jgi:hypothetical protein
MLNLCGACWVTLNSIWLKRSWLYKKEQNWYNERKQREKIEWIRKDTVAYFCAFIILTLHKSINKIHTVEYFLLGINPASELIQTLGLYPTENPLNQQHGERQKIHTALNFWTFYFHTTCTFTHYKFSPLIWISHAKFRQLTRKVACPKGIPERV